MSHYLWNRPTICYQNLHLISYWLPELTSNLLLSPRFLLVASPRERHLVHPVPLSGTRGLWLQARPAVHHDPGVASCGVGHGKLQRSAILAAPAEASPQHQQHAHTWRHLQAQELSEDSNSYTARRNRAWLQVLPSCIYNVFVDFCFLNLQLLLFVLILFCYELCLSYQRSSILDELYLFVSSLFFHEIIFLQFRLFFTYLSVMVSQTEFFVWKVHYFIII